MTIPELVHRHPNIILFDGVCDLCSAWVRLVYRWDSRGEFRFVSVQSNTGKALLTWCGLPTNRYDTMVYIKQGKAVFRSTAFLHVVKSLAFPWPLLAAGWVVPRPVRDWAYDRIALNRYGLFGRRERCFIPGEDLARRFLP